MKDKFASGLEIPSIDTITGKISEWYGGLKLSDHEAAKAKYGQPDYNPEVPGTDKESQGPGVNTPVQGRTVVSAPSFKVEDYKTDAELNKGPKGAKPQPKAVLKGEIPFQPSAEEYDANRKAQEQIDAVTHMQGMAFLQANLFAQKELEGFAYIAANDAAATRKLVVENFTEYQKRVNQLDKELDDIRSMRVNPYQYLNRSGVGGRVGAVLATAVSQISAGSGQIAPAVTALKNAIARDIEAQQSDIDIAFKGIQEGRKNVDAHVALLKEEIAGRELAMTKAWQAVQTIIQASQLGAQNEAAAMAYQIFDKYVQVERFAQKEAALAKLGTIYVTHEIFKIKDGIRAREMHAGLQQIMQGAVTAGAQLGQRSMQQGTQQPSVGGGGGVVTGGMGGKASVQSRRKPATNQAGAQQGMLPNPDAQMQDGVPDAIRRPEEDANAVVRKTAEQYQSEWAQDQLTYDTIKQRAKDKIPKGSNAAHYLSRAGSGIVGRLKSVGEMTEAFTNQPGVFDDPRNEMRPVTIDDAIEVVNRAYDDIGKNNPDPYWREFFQYAKDHPESITANTVYNVQGEPTKINTIYAPVLGRIKLSVMGEETPDSVREQAITTGENIKKLMDNADRIRTLGLAKNIFMVDSADGQGAWAKIWSSPETYAALAQLDEGITDLGVRWIKSRDPSGRLSDQDVALALRMIASARERKWDIGVDFVDSLFGDDVSGAREGAALFLERMALDAERAFINENYDKITMPLAKLKELKAQEDALAAKFRKRIAKQKADGTYEATRSIGDIRAMAFD
jgi:hypothetical protein